jgi:hypothetical protein
VKWPWVRREFYERAEERARIAEDRLYAAHKEGALIPPREAFQPKVPEVIELLPAKLLSYTQNWESVDTRSALEAEAREMLKLGWPEDRILETWQARTGERVETE